MAVFGSSRPTTALQQDPATDEYLSATSPQKMITQSPLDVKEVIRKARQEVVEERGEVGSLIYHTSDFTVTSIVDNPKVSGIGMVALIQYDACAS